MKARTRYLLAIVLLLVVAILTQTRLPQRFSWETSYDPDDRNPFGCYVFDSIMRTQMPHGYEVSALTLRQLSVADEPCNVLLVGEKLDLTPTDTAAIGRLLRRGSTIVVASERLHSVCDTIYSYYGVNKNTTSYFWLKGLKEQFLEPDDSTAYHTSTTQTVWLGHDGRFDKAAFRMPRMFGDGELSIDSTVSDTDVLAGQLTYTLEYYTDDNETWNEAPLEIDRDAELAYIRNQGHVFARKFAPAIVRRQVGRGQIIFCASPFWFTNFAALHPDMARNTNRIMTLLADRPTVRTTALIKESAEPEQKSSPFYFVLSQKPLRAALYMFLAAIVLALVFMARRRQRAIPVYTRPRNSMLDFARLLGTLHFQHREELEPTPTDDANSDIDPATTSNDNEKNTTI